PRVPLILEPRDRVHSPVDKDPELLILVPLRNGVPLQRRPRTAERPAPHHRLDLPQRPLYPLHSLPPLHATTGSTGYSGSSRWLPSQPGAFNSRPGGAAGG